MMKNKILGILFAGMLYTPISALAGEYPASNFQPKVIFSDDSVSSASSGQTTDFDPEFPAASFQPKVLYVDASAAKSTPSGETSSFDPKYPAANFEPKIIYP